VLSEHHPVVPSIEGSIPAGGPDQVTEELRENPLMVPGVAPADVPAALRTAGEPTLGAAGSAGNGRAPRGDSWRHERRRS
jgi:hypothetical protein